MNLIEHLQIGGGRKQSTIDSYERRLRVLHNGKAVDNLAFLYDYDVIIDKIQKYKITTQRGFIIAIVSALKEVKTMKAMYEKYSKLLEHYNIELKNNNSKSDVQKENWISQEEVYMVYNQLYETVEPLLCSKKSNITEIDFVKITELIVLSLFVLQPPRRILDYLIMYVVKKTPRELDKTINYFDISKRLFLFNNYKTSTTYNTQEVAITDRLYSILQCYLKIHPLKLTVSTKIPLLCDYQGNAFSTGNQITRILNKIFIRYTGKKISVNMLRSIFLTNKFKPQMDDLDTTAHDMGTSSNMIQTNYVKND
jgi:hypothetical protein